MSKCEVLAGATDQTIDVFIQDSSSSTGAGLTGLVYNTGSLTCYYRKGATGTPTALSLATQTVGGAHSDGGFVAVDGTNCPGQYRLDLSDTIVATAGKAYLHLKGAANMVPCVVEIEVVSVNKFDGVRMGMTALPNAPADAAGGLPISDAGGLDLDAQRTDVAAILVDTAEIGAAGAGLTNINLPNQTMDIVGNITGNLSGSVGSVTGTVGGVAGTTTTFDALQTALNSAHGAGSWATATGFSTHSAADVWAVATRVLTANTNLNDPTAAAIATAVLTTAMTESYRATNAAPTLAQAQFELIAHMGESSNAGTTKTLKKLDGSTTAKTYTYDDADDPTSITETT